MVLMAVLGLPLVSPLLAQGADLSAALPVCCRRGGVHQCMGNMGQPASSGTAVGAVQAKCPYCPGTVASVHAGGMLAERSALAFTSFRSGRVRVGRLRSRSLALRGEACPKRGPPGWNAL